MRRCPKRTTKRNKALKVRFNKIIFFLFQILYLNKPKNFKRLIRLHQVHLSWQTIWRQSIHSKRRPLRLFLLTIIFFLYLFDQNSIWLLFIINKSYFKKKEKESFVCFFLLFEIDIFWLFEARRFNCDGISQTLVLWFAKFVRRLSLLFGPELFHSFRDALVLFSKLALPLAQLLHFGIATNQIATIEGLYLQRGLLFGPNERFGQWRSRTLDYELFKYLIESNKKNKKLIEKILLYIIPLLNERNRPKVLLISLF